MKRILFVCLGNICRSPTAEAAFLAEVEKTAGDFEVDSAGTGDWHAGELSDRRMRQSAAKRGLKLESRARQVKLQDFEYFDHIYAMDQSNLDNLLAMAPETAASKIELFRNHDPEGVGEDVPDPYYGGPQGFEEVLDICQRTSQTLLEALR